MGDPNSIDLVRDFLQKIVDHLPIALFCKDARHNFQYVFWNETASRMWGRSTLEVVGQDDFELFPPEMAAFYRQKDKETMNAREIVYIPQESVPSPTGVMTARTWKIPIFGDDGGPQWLLGISQDISQPRLVESPLTEQGPIFVALDASTSRVLSPAAQIAQEALTALENGQTDLARALLESIKKLG
jgi:PAS domain S-box-containing protein